MLGVNARIRRAHQAYGLAFALLATADHHDERFTHYFSAAPRAPSAARDVPLALPDGHLTLRTDRGVFAHEGIDPGTKLLLLEAPMPEADRAVTVADVGCGYGPIALTVARRRRQAQLWAVDPNERARALCAENAERAGLDNITVCAPEQVPDGLRVDWVYSNPPIRVGKAALHRLLTSWLERLAPTGRMLLVVHKHLGADSLQRWLSANGRPTTRLRSRSGYRLLDVRPNAWEPPA